MLWVGENGVRDSKASWAAGDTLPLDILRADACNLFIRNFWPRLKKRSASDTSQSRPEPENLYLYVMLRNQFPLTTFPLRALMVNAGRARRFLRADVYFVVFIIKWCVNRLAWLSIPRLSILLSETVHTGRFGMAQCSNTRLTWLSCFIPYL